MGVEVQVLRKQGGLFAGVTRTLVEGVEEDMMLKKVVATESWNDEELRKRGIQRREKKRRGEQDEGKYTSTYLLNENDASFVRFIRLSIRNKNTCCVAVQHNQCRLRQPSASAGLSPARHDASALCFVTITLYLGYFTASVSKNTWTLHSACRVLGHGEGARQRPWSGRSRGGQGHTWLKIKDSRDQRSQQSTAPLVDTGEAAAGDPVSIMVTKHTPLQR
ncbi:hypothetical protein E2C01_011850 [Portunus trituberculatus]|uniref:Uncharacterized protein n=1 Tax=Portunus trituberculatus TaxID=210409 RepID=A0A5B7DC79_PORTR|nr:hypothetical protein [Portunus trituberculatus]